MLSEHGLHPEDLRVTMAYLFVFIRVEKGSIVTRMLKQKRPVFLNLWQIRFPITAIMSIMHRFTGVLLFLSIPFFIYTLQHSLESEAGFQAIGQYADSFAVKVILTLLIWSLLYHLLAGIRYLLLDVDLGIERQQSKLTAWLVIVSALVLLLVFAGLCL